MRQNFALSNKTTILRKNFNKTQPEDALSSHVDPHVLGRILNDTTIEELEQMSEDEFNAYIKVAAPDVMGDKVRQLEYLKVIHSQERGDVSGCWDLIDKRKIN